MFRWLGEIVDRLFVIMSAALFVQAPLFIQQYTYRLSGHVAELSLQIDALKNVAAQSGKTLVEYTQKFLHNSDPDFVRQGELMQGMVRRLEGLSDALNALNEASPFVRPFTFLNHFHADIAKATLYGFQPGFSLTLETVIFGVFGMFLGYTFFLIIKLTIFKIAKRKTISYS